MTLSIIKKAASVALVAGALSAIGASAAYAQTAQPGAFGSEVTITSTISEGDDGLITNCGGNAVLLYNIGSHAAAPTTATDAGNDLCVEVGSNVAWTADIAITDNFTRTYYAEADVDQLTPLTNDKTNESFFVDFNGDTDGMETVLTAPVQVADEPATSTTSDPFQIRSRGYAEDLASTLPAGLYEGELTVTVTQAV